MTSQQPYPPVAPYPAAAPRNGLGTAGFVTGLIGLVFSPIPFIGVIAWPLVIVGLSLSIIGFARANHGGATNKGLALAGIIVSALGLVVCIIWVAAFGKAVSDSANSLPAAPPAVSLGTPAAAAPDKAAASDKHTVVYKVTGTGKASTISYTNDGGTSTSSESNANLPWQKSIELPDGPAFQLVSIIAQGSGSGSIHVSIEVDGKVLKQSDASGYGLATADADIGSLGD
ncbi:DUF4190 domain-containing protein [Amycolatopsis saalfeldensis]|uniref:Membrane protein n=1 Tax=Amycolatopsis saalfeldensis TaxID=394193 RepID=A0A1H8T553_9PSEU|nr:DUF4190 domain-containing protein [Amycolatopsis saalfeldensis]SEO85648.1 membrane protein [Amycolatopsis saalfeldensis]